MESYRPGNYGRWECSNDRACTKRIASRRVTNVVEHHS